MDAYVVDAFTDAAFSGNAAGVVLLDKPAEASWMQSVAAEFKHAETAFVVVGVPENEPKPLRWFTPATEVELCGHATLATAHVLGGNQRFGTLSGILTCTALDEGWIEMDFPTDMTEPVEPPEELIEGLPGLTIEAVAQGRHDLLVRAGSAAEVRALHPDIPTLEQVAARCVIVTAPGDNEGTDFISRVFAPSVGIPEDPVTGSAHCTLAGWWSDKLRKTRMVGEQVSQRGGLVRTSLEHDRVKLQGTAVTVMRGNLLV